MAEGEPDNPVIKRDFRAEGKIIELANGVQDTSNGGGGGRSAQQGKCKLTAVAKKR